MDEENQVGSIQNELSLFCALPDLTCGTRIGARRALMIASRKYE
jgi:hypothetical protein